jgi:hypothetical protein
MKDLKEQRKSNRIDVECDMTFIQPNSSIEGLAQATTLSASGLTFKTLVKLTEGSALNISINSIQPPLNALVEVSKITVNENGSYDVSATIEGIIAS